MTTPTTAERPDAGAGRLTVAAFYKFVALDDLPALQQQVRERCRASGIRGTIALASEGINASVAGPPAAIDALLEYLRERTAIGPFGVTVTTTTGLPFRRLKVRIRPEIVSFGVAGIDPSRATGVHVNGATFNALLQRKDVVVLDTRNDYEHQLGSFTGAIEPHSQNFRAFPDYVKHDFPARPDQPVVMFCTGGVRCEKAAAYLLREGYREVYQLEGGILRYLAEVPAQDSQWRGDCFVFDDRVALDATLNESAISLCYGCRRPLNAAALASPLYEPGVCCPHCQAGLSSAQRVAFSERRRQVELAARRSTEHLGARMAADDDEQ